MLLLSTHVLSSLFVLVFFLAVLLLLFLALTILVVAAVGVHEEVALVVFRVTNFLFYVFSFRLLLFVCLVLC